MTEVVVVDKHSTVVVGSQQQSSVVRVDKSPTTIVTGMMGPAGSSGNLGDMRDVDTSNLTSGSLLVYNAGTAKWAATTLLNQQSVDCGEF